MVEEVPGALIEMRSGNETRARQLHAQALTETELSKFSPSQVSAINNFSKRFFAKYGISEGDVSVELIDGELEVDIIGDCDNDELRQTVAGARYELVELLKLENVLNSSTHIKLVDGEEVCCSKVRGACTISPTPSPTPSLTEKHAVRCCTEENPKRPSRTRSRLYQRRFYI